MLNNQYITIREAAQQLNVSEKAVLELIESQKLKAYKIADKFLRLKRSEVVAVGKSPHIQADAKPEPYTFGEKISDFFYFNDFYIVVFGVVLFLLYWILFR